MGAKTRSAESMEARKLYFFKGIINTCSRTRHLFVETVARSSRSQQVSRNFTQKRVSRTNPYAARTAVHSARANAIVVKGKCTTRYVHSAVHPPNCLSFPKTISPYIAANVSVAGGPTNPLCLAWRDKRY